MDKIDVGEYCVQCFHSVALGFGRFVNRIPADRCDGANFLHLDGWLCEECYHVDEKDVTFSRDFEPGQMF